MEYDDFSLPQQWEKMAQAYNETLKNKGFVFFRLDEDEREMQRLAQNALEELEKAMTAERLLQKKLHNSQISKTLYLLSDLTHLQIKKLVQLYGLTPSTQINSSQKMFPLAKQAIGQQCEVLKKLFDLAWQEDDLEKRTNLKAMIEHRLEVLSS